MSALKAVLLLAVASALNFGCLGGENPGAINEGQKILALKSDAAVIGRVGMLSSAENDNPAYAAVWIERALKGDLQGGRNIIWLSRREFPKAEAGPVLWLLFLSRDGDGSYHVLNGEEARAGAIIKVDSINAPLVESVAGYIGLYVPPPQVVPLTAEEACELVGSGSRGSQERRRESMLRLVHGGGEARAALLDALNSGDHQKVSLGQTLLPLMRGGPEVNGLRLILDPGIVVLKAGEERVLNLKFANVGDQPVRVVTGTSDWGENAAASAAWELRPVVHKKDGPPALGPALPTVLPAGFGLRQSLRQLPPQPLVREAPAFGVLPIAVAVRMETVIVDGKSASRLLFPHGHIDLPGPGLYSLRVHFACPGPRIDQPRLIAAQYWMGGQLASNDIQLEVR